MSEPAASPVRRAPLPDIWWRQTLTTRRWIAGAVLAAIVAGLGITAASLFGDGPAQSEAEAFVGAMSISELLQWELIAQCESERQWDLETGNGFSGGLQFTQTSWNGVGGTGSPAQNTREEQIMRATMLFDAQGWSAWPSCSAQLGFAG